MRAGAFSSSIPTLELVRFSQRHPGVFLTDQGIFNFMLFGGADQGMLRLAVRELQVLAPRRNLPGEWRPEELARRFSGVDTQPGVVETPVVLHWAGPFKPVIRGQRGDFFDPMTFFRRRFRLDKRGSDRLTLRDELVLRTEDIPERLRPLRKRLERKCRSAVSRVRSRLQ